MEGAAGHSGGEEDEAVAESAAAISSVSPAACVSPARAPGRSGTRPGGCLGSQGIGHFGRRTGVCWQEAVCLFDLYSIVLISYKKYINNIHTFNLMGNTILLYVNKIYNLKFPTYVGITYIKIVVPRKTYNFVVDIFFKKNRFRLRYLFCPLILKSNFKNNVNDLRC